VRQQEQDVGFNVCNQICNGQIVSIDAEGNILPSTVLGGTCGTPPAASPATTGMPTQVLESDPHADPTSSFVDAAGNQCVANTNCIYSCSFTVYTEVALTVISKPSNCGCAFHIQMVNPRPARVVTANVVSSQLSNNVTVGPFQLVVWDYVANRVVETVPSFHLTQDAATTAAIAAQVMAGNTEDFTTLTAGFAGQVASYTMLPESLDQNILANANNVPALQFNITQTYTDSKAWTPPLQPSLSDTPNAYQTQCVPFWPQTPYCYNSMGGKKRQTGPVLDPGHPNEACSGATPTVWFKRFMLFPKVSQIAANQGVVYASRFITSFYNGDTCRRAQGLFSIDSEFTSTISATDMGANLALGTWSWDRVYKDGMNGASFSTQYILGVPGSFSGIQQVWDKGYSQITWEAPTGYVAGTAGSSSVTIVSAGICSTFNPAGPPAANPKYGEVALTYQFQSGINCAPNDNAIRDPTCGTATVPDKSLMAFLNDGQILNFNKMPDSTLIVGKQTAACNTQPYSVLAFDVLLYTGVPAGVEPISPDTTKRSVLDKNFQYRGMIYDEEHEALVHYLSPRGAAVLSQPHKRDLASAMLAQVATPPNANNYDMRVAAGSTDNFGQDSANAGDHPIQLFPETFTAPINIDPQANTSAVVVADVTTGSAIPVCNAGSIGCSCRTAGIDCDIGLTCDSTNICFMQGCSPGSAGCPCNNGACSSGNTCQTNADGTNTCLVSPTCTAGSAGCQCTFANGAPTCTDNVSQCTDGFCVLPGSCSMGDAGCACGINNGTCGGTFVCNALLDVCLAPRCVDGTPGCRCNSDLSCDTGFECQTNGICAQLDCPVGNPGCSCTNTMTCNAVGFNCVAYTQMGDYRCIATPEPNCGDQTARCVAQCGTNNVATCPRCDNGAVLCLQAPCNGGASFGSACSPCVLDPYGPTCSSASSMVFAAVALLVAVVAAL
jgi:hypothetical protein